MLFEMFSWTDAGEHQQLGRVDGTCADDHFAFDVDNIGEGESVKLHTDRPFVVVEDDLWRV